MFGCEVYTTHTHTHTHTRSSHESHINGDPFSDRGLKSIKHQGGSALTSATTLLPHQVVAARYTTHTHTHTHTHAPSPTTRSLTHTLTHAKHTSTSITLKYKTTHTHIQTHTHTPPQTLTHTHTHGPVTTDTFAKDEINVPL